jgi:DNA-binding LacI/PurR family transcriptional regulator
MPLLRRSRLDQEISILLRKEILQNHRAGDRLPAEVELAKRFSVSAGTVAKAIIALSAEGLVERRHGSGTYVTDRSTQKHVAIIADWDIAQPRVSFFFLRVIQSLRGYFHQQGRRSRVYLGYREDEGKTTSEVQAEFSEELEAGRVAGAVAVMPPWKWHRQFEQCGVPVVGSGAVGVDDDREVTGRLGARYLLDCGRRRIALLGWADRYRLAPGAASLVNGFRAEAQARGVNVREEWIRCDINPGLIAAGWAEFREIWTSASEKPDGLFVSDDVLFRDAASAILELGIKSPAQLLVITHANRGSGMHAPFPVARLEYDPDAHATTMGEMLMSLMKGESLTQPRVLLSHRLLPMEECAPSPVEHEVEQREGR